MKDRFLKTALGFVLMAFIMIFIISSIEPGYFPDYVNYSWVGWLLGIFIIISVSGLVIYNLKKR